MNSNKEPRKRGGVATLGAFFAFFVFGLVDNMKGPTLPAILRDLELTYTQGGTILLGGYLGFLLATLLTGYLSDIAGRRAPILVAGAALILGIAGYASLGSFLPLAGAMTLIGVGLGAIEVGGNTLVVELHSEKRGLYLNLLSFFHGFASMVAPAYAGALLGRGSSWRVVYLWLLIPVIVLTVYFVPGALRAGKQSASHGTILGGVGRAAFTRRMSLYYLAMTAYVAAEIGTASWLVEFLQTARGMSVVASSLALSLFFLAVTAGRLGGGFVVEAVGYRRTLLIAALASAGTVAFGALGPPAVWWLLPMTGLFFSVCFPTITAAVSAEHRENTGTILGLLFTFAGVGGMMGPWSMGLVADLADIRYAFSPIIVFLLIMAFSLLFLGPHLRYDGPRE
jgi:fucose permease